MFNFKGRASKNVPVISEEQLTELFEILSTVGLSDPDHWGFRHHVQKRENYRGGSLEWSERGIGMRYYFWAREDSPIYEALVTPLHTKTHPIYTPEIIAEANRRLAELFAV